MNSETTELLRTAQLRFLRVLWCDNANIIRGKAIHASLLGDLPHGIGITAAQMALPVMYDAVIPETGYGPVGEVRLIPDWDTFMPLPYAPGHARVMGDMIVDGSPWALCPREFLRRMTASAAKDGFEVIAAFENEFYLLRPTADGFAPLDDTVFASALGIDRARAVIDDLTDALLAQRVPVELYYPESGPGQQELSVGHTTALAAADRQIVFRETAHAIAIQHGLRACFLPKIFENVAGNGCHLHLSLSRKGTNIFPDPTGAGGLSATARAFLAGVLDHLPALCALTAASPNSYRRLKPLSWAGAFRCWGADNREAALRVPTSPSGTGSTNFEIKTSDASANPYFACGGVIAAGLDGIRRNLDLPAMTDVDPGTLSESERTQRGIGSLPTNLGEAIEHLRRDDVLLAALGPELSRAYLAVRQAEWEALRDLDLEAEVKLLAERY